MSLLNLFVSRISQKPVKSGASDLTELDPMSSWIAQRESNISTKSRTQLSLVSNGPPRKVSCVRRTCAVSVFVQISDKISRLQWWYLFFWPYSQYDGFKHSSTGLKLYADTPECILPLKNSNFKLFFQPFVSTFMTWLFMLTQSIVEAVRSFQLLVVSSMLRSSQLHHVLWSLSTCAKSNVLKSPSEESTVCSIVVVDTFSKKLKFPEHPCSSSKLSCPSTSRSVSLPISARTPVDKLSHSACLTIGKSSQETRTNHHRSPIKSYKKPANARVLRRDFQTWLNTTTRCKACKRCDIYQNPLLLFVFLLFQLNFFYDALVAHHKISFFLLITSFYD